MLLSNRVEYNLPERVKLTYISTSEALLFLKPFKWLKGLRANFKPDVIISFFARINLLVLLASLGLKKRVFISERSDPKSDTRSIMIKALTSILYPLSNGIIFQTKYAMNCFPKKLQKKSTIISNPININFDFRQKKS